MRSPNRSLNWSAGVMSHCERATSAPASNTRQQRLMLKPWVHLRARFTVVLPVAFSLLSFSACAVTRERPSPSARATNCSPTGTTDPRSRQWAAAALHRPGATAYIDGCACRDDELVELLVDYDHPNVDAQGADADHSRLETWLVDCSRQAGVRLSVAGFEGRMGQGRLVGDGCLMQDDPDLQQTPEVRGICDFLARNGLVQECKSPRRRPKQRW
jgi:hypothetical protein